MIIWRADGFRTHHVMVRERTLDRCATEQSILERTLNKFLPPVKKLERDVRIRQGLLKRGMRDDSDLNPPLVTTDRQ